MDLTRRQFVIAAAAGIAARSTRVRIRIIGSRGREGAELGVDEMSRTATLLGSTLQVVDAADALAIDLNEGRLLADGVTFYVAASEAARRAALASWRRDHGDGAHAVMEWHPHLEKFGAGELNERFLRRFKTPMDARAWIGWMLVKIPVEAALRRASIRDARFDGHKGVPLTFNAEGWLIQPLYIVDGEGRLLGVADTAQHG